MVFSHFQLLLFNFLYILVNGKATVFETELNKIFDVQDCLTNLLISNTESQTCKEVVNVNLYYESLCPDCISFDTQNLLEVILKLKDNVKIKTYPYGNARTHIDEQGKVTIVCQHGEAECYGNKLHACALDLLSNHTEALLYNICMMEPSENSRGSDDKASDRCSETIPVDSSAIKACAKTERGFKLLKYYGDETHKVNPHYVPYVLVNDKLYDQATNPDFFTYLCDQFTDPPNGCASKFLELLSNLKYFTNTDY